MLILQLVLINTDLVNDTSPQLGGTLDTNGNSIDFGDDDRLRIGTGQATNMMITVIYHDISFLQSAEGDLYLTKMMTMMLLSKLTMVLVVLQIISV